MEGTGVQVPLKGAGLFSVHIYKSVGSVGGPDSVMVLVVCIASILRKH